MALLRTLCWALIFILRLRFPPGSSLASSCIFSYYFRRHFLASFLDSPMCLKFNRGVKLLHNVYIHSSTSNIFRQPVVPFYTTIHINEAISLVLVRALLEYRSQTTSHNNKTFFSIFSLAFFNTFDVEKQIDFILLCMCAVIDHGSRHCVKRRKSHGTRLRLVVSNAMTSP